MSVTIVETAKYDLKSPYIIEGFPGIGPTTARKLIEKFKTIKNIINASKEELEEILGKKTDLFIRTICD